MVFDAIERLPDGFHIGLGALCALVWIGKHLL